MIYNHTRCPQPLFLLPFLFRIRMSARCSSSDFSSKISGMAAQVKQYKSMLEATEKASASRLFAARIYEEDKTVIQAKISKKLLDMKDIIKQCTHH
jgi:hypothetical protein